MIVALCRTHLIVKNDGAMIGRILFFALNIAQSAEWFPCGGHLRCRLPLVCHGSSGLGGHLRVIGVYTRIVLPSFSHAMNASVFPAFLQEHEYRSGPDEMQHACSKGVSAQQFVDFFMALRANQQHYQPAWDVQHLLAVIAGQGQQWFMHLSDRLIPYVLCLFISR